MVGNKDNNARHRLIYEGKKCSKTLRCSVLQDQ